MTTHPDILLGLSPAARAQLARLHTLAATHGRTPEEALGDLERHYQERA